MKRLFLILSVFSILSIPTFATSFDDVDENETFSEGINFLQQEGIVNGNPDGTFKPLKTLNRAEMLKILIEALIKDGVIPKTDLEGVNMENCFDDIQKDVWFGKYVCYAKQKGWVVGYLNGKVFRPAQDVNFVEALKMALKAFKVDYVEDKTVWYKPIVEKASTDNLIPFTINEFGVNLKRNEMADMVTRIVKKRRNSLDEYLGDRKDVKVDFNSIKERKDLSKLIKKIVKETMKKSDQDSAKSRYMNYSEENRVFSFQNGRTIMFFYTANCDSCNTIDKQLKEAIDELPNDVRILKIDYDTATDLKNKYGVLTASTLVLLNSDGNETDRWTGGDLETIKTKTGAKKAEPEKKSVETKTQVTAPASKAAARFHIVTVTNKGFAPNPLTINAGDVITFINNDTQSHWPASASHPTHTVYPGSGIAKCGTGVAIFDACKALTENMMFEFTMKEKGTWGYHDHLNPSLTGTIIVK